MKPKGGGSMPSKLEDKISSDLEVDEFKKQFIQEELRNLVQVVLAIN